MGSEPYIISSLGREDLKALVGLGGGEARRAPYTGTKALMLAVLEDAIRGFLSEEEVAGTEAKQWIFSSERRSVFSFVVVCETLGLEPKAVRVALRRLKAKNTSPELWPRTRPNARQRSALANSHGSK